MTRYPESWGEFPDVTDSHEPILPDACQSELKVAGAYRVLNPDNYHPQKGLDRNEHQ